MKRSRAGMSVIELMVSALLMGLSMAAVGELVVLNTYSSTKLNNGADGQVGCSRAIRRIAEDIRASQAIVASSSYGTSGPQTLVLQQPSFYQNSQSNLNGFPLLQQSIANGNSIYIACVDTVVYQLSADINNPGTYQLLVSRFPGTPVVASVTRPLLNPPQVVLSGVVGPSDAQSASPGPTIFQYLTTANDNTYPPPVPSSAPPLGVYINIEVQTPPSGHGANLQRVGAHVESYLRCNTATRQTNQ